WMNMPKRASCHHFMRRTRSAGSPVCGGSSVGGANCAGRLHGMAAIPAAVAAPASHARRENAESFMGFLLSWHVFRIGLLRFSNDGLPWPAQDVQRPSLDLFRLARYFARNHCVLRSKIFSIGSHFSPGPASAKGFWKRHISSSHSWTLGFSASARCLASKENVEFTSMIMNKRV